MNELNFLITIAGIYFMLAVSPGPNFLIISVAAAGKSRLYATFVALGVSTASVFWSGLAAMGLGLVLAQFQGSQRALQIFGGMYLLYIAFKTLKNAKAPLAKNIEVSADLNVFSGYLSGLLTNLGNPKSLIFFSSVFATLYTPDITTTLKVWSILVVGVVSIGWNLVVVFVFSSKQSQNIYTGSMKWIDYMTGGLIGFCSLKLILNF